jgi:hypothetical protein
MFGSQKDLHVILGERKEDDLYVVLGELATLNKAENTRVALKARQVLIASYQAPYEVRHNQVESIFLSAIDMVGHEFCQENLKVIECLFSVQQHATNVP